VRAAETYFAMMSRDVRMLANSLRSFRILSRSPVPAALALSRESMSALSRFSRLARSSFSQRDVNGRESWSSTHEMQRTSVKDRRSAETSLRHVTSGSAPHPIIMRLTPPAALRIAISCWSVATRNMQKCKPHAHRGSHVKLASSWRAVRRDRSAPRNGHGGTDRGSRVVPSADHSPVQGHGLG
jgi:hypothetical protein